MNSFFVSHTQILYFIIFLKKYKIDIKKREKHTSKNCIEYFINIEYFFFFIKISLEHFY